MVTIAIPVYNEGLFLEKTIQSAINQTYKDIKIIISDNCSTDTSYEIASKFLPDSRIEIHRQPENIGPLLNFKFLLDKCKTEYFIWFGAHDILMNSCIEDCLNMFEVHSGASLVYPHAVFFDEDVNGTGENADSDINTLGLTLEQKAIKIAAKLSHCTAIHGVFKASVAKKIPFKKMISPDHLMLFHAAVSGDIIFSKPLGLNRRVVRKENDKEREQRYRQLNFFNNKEYSPFNTFTLQHILYIFSSNNIPLRMKLIISYKIKNIFSCRFYGISWIGIARQFFLLPFVKY